MNRKKAIETFPQIYREIKKMSPSHHFEFKDPFWVLITTMLSHRTKDEVTDAAARSLYNKYRTAENLSRADVRDVRKLIARVGFSNVKSERIINAASLIVNEFGGKVPERLEDMTRIPGVGRKTANVVLSDSMSIPAIAVDTHVQRISVRIGWSRSSDPEETELILKKIVPKKMWIGFNPTMVEFGKTICRPVHPLCEKCKINKYCEYYRRTKRD